MTHAEAFEKAKEEATTKYPDGSSALDFGNYVRLLNKYLADEK
jgi:hypothetical protein